MSSITFIDYLSAPTGPLQGSLCVHGDKSISHRAIILGAIANGITRIKGILKSADTIATVNVFREMGVRIDEADEEVAVFGQGKYGLQAPVRPLYFGNSGTSVRLLAGLLAGQRFNTILTGDESLSRRPMKRIADPLSEMGGEVSCSTQGTLPIQIQGEKNLHGISYDIPVPSAQLNSCLMLAGLYAEGKTRICEPAVTRDHTERMLALFGSNLSVNNLCVEIFAEELQSITVNVPGDISSAAFFLVAGCISPGSDMLLKNIGVNPTRHAVIEILSRMGADIQVHPIDNNGAEPVADIRVKYRPLKGIVIPSELVPIAMDEFPAIMIAAANAEGETELNGVAELRVKESDRIEALADGLKRLGIDVKTRSDGMTVKGGNLQPGKIDS